MEYKGRITLLSSSLSFSLISLFIFKEPLLEQIPTSIVA